MTLKQYNKYVNIFILCVILISIYIIGTITIQEFIVLIFIKFVSKLLVKKNNHH